MSRRRRGRNVHGMVLLDKPEGLSSNRALQKVRTLFDARKAGHTGSLDPFATGMLPLCLGEATKTAAFMLDADKAYRATACLGAATETGDTEGAVSATADVPELGFVRITDAMSVLTGVIQQVPPMYSALKHGGRPLYELARKGIEIERESRSVTIHRLALLEWQPPILSFEVTCSKGTYVRTLAEDLAGELGTIGHLRTLRRLWVAPFDEKSMVSLEQLEEWADEHRLDEHLMPPDAGLVDWPVVRLAEQEVIRFRHGNPVSIPADIAADVRVYDGKKRLLGLASAGAGILKPRRVFNIEWD